MRHNSAIHWQKKSALRSRTQSLAYEAVEIPAHCRGAFWVPSRGRVLTPPRGKGKTGLFGEERPAEKVLQANDHSIWKKNMAAERRKVSPCRGLPEKMQLSKHQKKTEGKDIKPSGMEQETSTTA